MFPLDTRILLVDDQPPMRELVRTQLRALGYGGATSSIRQATDGKNALYIMEEALKVYLPVQLIISDWEMPVMSGLEFLKAVRADPRHATIPVVLLTAVNRQEQVLEAIKAGVNNYISKPFSKATLVEKLERTWQAVNAKK
jgi:two-component system chemotaxis response regulator CheY